MSSFYADANAVWPTPYLFYKSHYVFIPNPWLETSLSDSVSSLPLINGAASNSLIQTQKPHAVFPCLLPLLTLRQRAGRVRNRRWEKTSPAVRQICLFTFCKVKANDEGGNNVIFLPVISVATVTLLQISAPDNRCIISRHYGNTRRAVYSPDFSLYNTLGVYCRYAIFSLS